MRYGYQEPLSDNPYEPPEEIPQTRYMAAKDFIVFLFLSISLGFCIGVVTTAFLLF